ncbi:MAG: hypothetical protein J1E85_10330 [Ruminococcus sp.]|nr:hypothetical protein [Ruminococcus sp.]
MHRIKIRDVFNKYVGTEIKKGFSRCPFHNEKTASFKLFENTNSFYCFGCGIGGDEINLVSKLFNISYYEAMKKLNEDYGLEVFQKVKKTDIRRSKEATEQARKRLIAEQLAIKRKDSYFKLIEYFKWLQNQPQTSSVLHDLQFIERLLDRWILYDCELFDRIPEEFNADALIYALKSKFTGEEENNGE